MIGSFAKLKLVFCLLYLASKVCSQPGFNSAGGTNCPGTVGTSYNCDTRCAVVTGAGAGTWNGLPLRYCNSDLTNYNCTCGCDTNSASYFWYMYDNKTCSNGCPPNYYPPSSYGYACLQCDFRCLTCTGSSNTQCSTCSTFAFQLNATSCYY